MKRILDAAVVLLAAAILLIIATGGVDVAAGVIHFRLHSIGRPAILLLLVTAFRYWLAPFDVPDIVKRGLIALVIATGAVYSIYQVRVCGGLDSYGYVSAASLIASGHLSQPQPLVPLLPFEGASTAAAPLGYVPGRIPGTEVPRFPLGLPLMMAAFKVFGPTGPFQVPLLMAYGAIALAFLLARKPDGDASAISIAGWFAAALVAVDPLMIAYGIQPMSDVPAMCCLLASLWLRLRSSARDKFLDAATLSGFCAGMAFLTRPALLPAALMIGAVTLDRPRREAIRFWSMLLAFVAAQLVLNTVLYGNARTSGYGPASYMFELSLARLTANASNYGRWLTYSHTFVIWLLWPAALIVLRRSRWAWQISAVAAAAAAPYLFYLVFDDWDSSRFLLPAIALVLILAARGIAEVMDRTKTVGAVTMLVVAFAFAAASNRVLQNEGVYRLHDIEMKFALAGEWIDAHTPARAVILAGLHSGSIRFYAGRQTVRWDQVPSDKLSATITSLRGAGYEPYVVLDVPTEPPLFDERFSTDPSVHIEQIGRVRVVNFYRFVSAH